MELTKNIYLVPGLDHSVVHVLAQSHIPEHTLIVSHVGYFIEQKTVSGSAAFTTSHPNWGPQVTGPPEAPHERSPESVSHSAGALSSPCAGVERPAQMKHDAKESGPTGFWVLGRLVCRKTSAPEQRLSTVCAVSGKWGRKGQVAFRVTVGPVFPAVSSAPTIYTKLSNSTWHNQP